MSVMLELAERCEQATEAEQLLDWEIFGALGNRPHRIGAMTVWRDAIGAEWLATSGSVPRYTASIDAAIMLVPEGWCWMAQTNRHSPCGRAGCDLSQSAPFKPEDWLCRTARAATPALALCAAALKARAASCDTHPKDGDVKQAPLVSGAVPNGETP